MLFPTLGKASSILSKSCDTSRHRRHEQPLAEPKFPLKKFEYMEGRNYRQSQKPNEQFLPCDDEEIERLQINHILMKSLFVSTFFAPVADQLKEGIKVLEVATGPGWWLIDMATQYPKSHFTGIDTMIYPISLPPANCHIKVFDISKKLPYPDNTFDYVTQHEALLRYSQQDWDAILPELIRVCKPGGYIESVEQSGNYQDIGPNMSIWMMRLTVSLQTRQINLKIATQLQSMLEELGGLESIEASHRSAPIGWYGRNGDLMLESVERLFDAIKPKLCEDWSMSSGKYDKIVQAASAECKDFRSWINIHYVYGRKKLEGTTGDSTSTTTEDTAVGSMNQTVVDSDSSVNNDKNTVNDSMDDTHTTVGSCDNEQL
ncbi:S-adenosyl-L-methionine-dependent methyltransferase [Pilobolus umbonatus]|nr:S-adenosyl-L-methionine-dependent methyltransferase [Pilobolus umbonatus]